MPAPFFSHPRRGRLFSLARVCCARESRRTQQLSSALSLPSSSSRRCYYSSSPAAHSFGHKSKSRNQEAPFRIRNQLKLPSFVHLSLSELISSSEEDGQRREQNSVLTTRIKKSITLDKVQRLVQPKSDSFNPKLRSSQLTINRKNLQNFPALQRLVARSIVLEHRRLFSKESGASSSSASFSSVGSDDEKNAREAEKDNPNITMDLKSVERSDSISADTASSSSHNSKKKLRRKREPMIVPNYGADADQAIRSLQAARKERARAKTFKNVQRALYGNLIICVAKCGAWVSSGSSAMMSEFVHSVVDCGNQALLLLGLQDSRNAADRLHPYGYGKSVYFWALVSALGTFFLGAGVSLSHAVGELMEPVSEIVPDHIFVSSAVCLQLTTKISTLC